MGVCFYTRDGARIFRVGASSLPKVGSEPKVGVAGVRGQVQCLRGKHAAELVPDPDVLRLVGGLEERA